MFTFSLTRRFMQVLLDGEGGGGGTSGGSGSGGEGGSGEGGAGGEGSQGEGGQGGSGGGDEWTPPTRQETENLQRQAREAQAESKRLKDAETERQRKADAEAGNHQAIADREKKRADDAEARAAKVEEDRQIEVQERRVEKVARRLNFIDPADVLNKVPAADRDDDTKVEKALRAVAKEKPYLVTDGEKPKTRDLSNGDGKQQDGTQATGVDRLSRAYANSSSDKT